MRVIEGRDQPALPNDQAPRVPTRRTLKLDDIVIDAGTQARAEVDQDTVDRFADEVNDGNEYDAVSVFHDGEANYLADGFHRYAAFRKLEREEIDADVHSGTREEALWFALGANSRHGRRMTPADKRHAIEVALATWPDLSQVRLARQIGCSHQYVGKIRGQVATRRNLPQRVVGVDGKSYPAKQTRSVETTRDVGDDRRTDRLDTADTADEPEAESIGAETGPTPEPIGNEPGSEEKDGAEALPRAADEEGDLAPEKRSNATAADKRNGKEPSRRTRDRSNRIVSSVAADAKILVEQEYLVDFSALERDQLDGWIAELQEARRKLSSFINKLIKERRHDGRTGGTQSEDQAGTN